MGISKVSDEEILRAWPTCPSSSELSRRFGIAKRVMDARVSKLRSRGHQLPSPDSRSPAYKVHRQLEDYPARLAVEIDNGVVLVGSDAHYVRGVKTTAQRAFEKFCRELKPRVVVMNGDLFDGASVSRWPRIGWEHRPTVKDELAAVDENLTAIEAAVPSAEKVWSMGNHDQRFELRLAQAAPEYEGVSGFSLKEHFSLWRPCWSLWVNDTTVIKHRFRSGVHASYNSTVHAGKTLVHGHLHSLKVYPFTDYNGTRYGVDSGTLSDTYGGAFEGYMEDNPRSWRSGFVVLTYHNGKLLWPEVVSVVEENKVDFRGAAHSV